MPKINVYLPDELAEAVRDTGVPVSAICQRALEQAVRRVTAIRETALADLDTADLATQLPQFTARARNAVQLAVEQARAEAAAGVGTAHLLGGLLAEGDNLGLRVLQTVEVAPEQVRRDLDRHSAAEPSGSPQGKPALFTSSATGALQLAVTEATAFGHNYVGCEHLLLGLIGEPDGTAGHVLRSLGADARLTRRAVAAALAGYVHLRAQTSPVAPDADPAAAMTAVLQRELRPLVERIERLEQHVGLSEDTDGAQP